MMMVGDLNQDAVLAATGLQLPGAHSFFVGNPRIGKTFFDATQAIGAVIPVRVHVWVDGDGPAHISYFDPARSSPPSIRLSAMPGGRYPNRFAPSPKPRWAPVAHLRRPLR
ncbi:hypothetical protein I546_3025 [Mycobacterium kansasii 732]|nr:hypothetical protein I546_3025 [Mycobacterium kansasii 732]